MPRRWRREEGQGEVGVAEEEEEAESRRPIALKDAAGVWNSNRD
jgi:hypothetical protein